MRAADTLLYVEWRDDDSAVFSRCAAPRYAHATLRADVIHMLMPS